MLYCVLFLYVWTLKRKSNKLAEEYPKINAQLRVLLNIRDLCKHYPSQEIEHFRHTCAPLQLLFLSPFHLKKIVLIYILFKPAHFKALCECNSTAHIFLHLILFTHNIVFWDLFLFCITIILPCSLSYSGLLHTYTIF